MKKVTKLIYAFFFSLFALFLGSCDLIPGLSLDIFYPSDDVSIQFPSDIIDDNSEDKSNDASDNNAEDIKKFIANRIIESYFKSTTVSENFTLPVSMTYLNSSVGIDWRVSGNDYVKIIPHNNYEVLVSIDKYGMYQAGVSNEFTLSFDIIDNSNHHLVKHVKLFVDLNFTDYISLAQQNLYDNYIKSVTIEEALELPTQFTYNKDNGKIVKISYNYEIICPEETISEIELELYYKYDLVYVVFTPDRVIKDKEYNFDLKITIQDENNQSNEFIQPLTIFIETKPLVLNTYEEYIQAAKEESNEHITIKAYISAIYDGASLTKSAMLVDEYNNGYFAFSPNYKNASTIEEILSMYPRGSEVIVTGRVKDYLGQIEFDAGADIYLTGNYKELDDKLNATEDFANAISINDESVAKYHNHLVTIDNCEIIEAIDKKTYKFIVNNGTFVNTYYIKGNLVDAEEIKVLQEKVNVGFILSITGYCYVYGDSFNIVPLSKDSVSIINGKVDDSVVFQSAKSELLSHFANLQLYENNSYVLPKTAANGVVFEYEVDGYYNILSNYELFIREINKDATTINVKAIINGVEYNQFEITLNLYVDTYKHYTPTEMFNENNTYAKKIYLDGKIEIGASKFYVYDDNKRIYLNGISNYTEFVGKITNGSFVVLEFKEEDIVKAGEISKARLISYSNIEEGRQLPIITTNTVKQYEVELGDSAETVSYGESLLSSYVTYAKSSQIRLLCEDGSSLLLYKTVDASGYNYLPSVGEYITVIVDNFMMYGGEIEAVNAVVLQSYNCLSEDIIYCNGLKNDTKIGTVDYTITSALLEKQNMPEGENVASILNLDESLWTVVAHKNDCVQTPYCTITGEFRLYTGRVGGVINYNGSDITFTINEGTIKSIKIYYSIGYESKATVFVSGEVVSCAGDDIYNLYSNTFTIKNETEAQVRIYLIEVEMVK